MSNDPHNTYHGKIQAVIFDWAGTTIDYGCFAPLIAFQEIFLEEGVEPTMKEIRKPMGIAKREHIKKMLKGKRLKKLWKSKFGHKPKNDDIDRIYNRFEKKLFALLPDYSNPVPGAVDLVRRLRRRKLKIGSTTGYTREMINIIEPLAKIQGYEPDSIVTSSDVPKGRPSPLMCLQNAVNLKAYPTEAIVKVGDTVNDIEEGLNARMWSVGILKGGSTLGLTEQEVEELDKKKLKKKMKKAAKKLEKAGAHYIIDSIGDLDRVIDEIEKKLKKGKGPE